MSEHERDDDDEVNSLSLGSRGSSNSPSPKKGQLRNTYTRLLERMSIYTIEEADENTDSVLS